MDGPWIINSTQLADLRRFASDLVDGQMEEDDQIRMGHQIELIITNCESMPADEDEDDEIEGEDDDDETKR